MTDAILILNAGSSSLKSGLFEIRPGQDLVPIARDEVEAPGAGPGFESLVESIIGQAEARLGEGGLRVVGHRVVHGGPDHGAPERVTPDLLDALERLIPLAPLHQPMNLAPIRAVARMRPGMTQVACFDTAFHHGMAAVATRLALPREYEAAGVRRYGFHGLSYEFIARRLARIAPVEANGRVIAAHLGAGASLCAMRAGRSVDTTMGFSTLDGLVMATRCGDLDPGVILYLLRQCGLSSGQVEELLYLKAGLLGVSGGLSGDMRVLLASADTRAREAIELFAFRLAREMGALMSTLEGLDTLVFTAGIGEHAPRIRQLVCARLAWLGVDLDPDANDRGDAIISTPASRIVVRVMATDEDAMIADHTRDVAVV